MPTTRQDQDFATLLEKEVDTVTLSGGSLDVAIEWIASNLKPDDVFPDSDLEDWAEKNNYIKKED